MIFLSTLMTFYDLTRYYQENYLKYCSKAYQQRNNSLLRRFIPDAMNRENISNITSMQILNVIGSAKKEGTDMVVAGLFSLISDIFQLGYEAGILFENPCDNRDLFRIPKFHRPNMYLYTPDQFILINDAIAHNYLCNFYRFIMLTGTTLKETCGISHEDFSRESRLLMIRNSRAPRSIPLSDIQISVLDAEIKRQNRNREIEESRWHNPDHLIFTEYTGSHLKKYKICWNNQLIRERTGITDFCPSRLRIHFILSCFRKNLAPELVGNYVGITHTWQQARFLEESRKNQRRQFGERSGEEILADILQRAGDVND